MAILTAGDQTEIGEKGINLSGGQKARLSLARAVYQASDVILMDDPISALDSQVRKQVFEQVIQGPMLKKKTRVLVTHAIDFLKFADRIVILKEGRIWANGSFEELQSNPHLQEVLAIKKRNLEETQAKQTSATNSRNSPEKSLFDKSTEASETSGSSRSRISSLEITEDEEGTSKENPKKELS